MVPSYTRRRSKPGASISRAWFRSRRIHGGMPEWLKGTDCKSVGSAYVGSNPTPSTIRQRIGQPRRSEEHTSELQSLMRISYAVFCLKKNTTTTQNNPQN